MAQSVSFLPPASYNAGPNPSSVVIADFNGDGRPDVAVANTNGTNSNDVVTVFLGGPSGTLLNGASFPAGRSPYALAVGDFNRDGKLDLAVTSNSLSGSVSILLSNGDGTFQSPVSYATGSQSVGITVGDFDSDGKLDLAVTNGNSNSVSVLLGNGDGTFKPAVNYPVAAAPTSIAAGDFNRDGKVDLAVLNFSSPHLNILLGNGDGTFQNAVTYPFITGASLPQAMALADVNGDGVLDVVAGNSPAGTVTVFLGNSNGSFQPAADYPAGNAPSAILMGDFDRDGKLDVVTADPAGTVRFLRGNGDGTFAASISLGDIPNALRLASADLDGDGRADIFVAGANLVSVLLNSTGAPPFGCYAPRVSYNVGIDPAMVAVGDFNRDGKLDLAVGNNGGTDVSILLGNGDGTFQPAQSFQAGTHPAYIAVADFNRDGKLDLAVENFDSDNVSVLMGNGDGTFQNAVNYAVGAKPRALVEGDFNRDGHTDLAVTSSSGVVSVLLGIGNGTFQPRVDYAAGTGPFSVVQGDFNRDGKLDLAVTNDGGNNLSLLLGRGDGTFQPQVTFPTGLNPRWSEAADFNHDGKLDLVVPDFSAGNVGVLLGNGTGSFQGIATYPAGTGIYSVTTLDADGDGRLDIAAADYVGNRVFLLTGNGDGTFQPARALPSGVNPQFIAVGDFNRDDRPDLAVVNRNDETVSIYINQPCPGGATHFSVAVPNNADAGTPFPFTVTALDRFNLTATSYRGAARFSTTDPVATLPTDYPFTAGDSGQHVFSAALRTSGAQTISSSDTLTTVEGISSPINVIPGAAVSYTLSSPASVAQGVSFNLTLSARDVFGNLDPSYQGTAHFTSSDLAASLPADFTFAAPDGGAHVFPITLNTLGNVMVAAADTVATSITGSKSIDVAMFASSASLALTPLPDARSRQSVALDITVSASSGTPGGNVTLLDLGRTVCVLSQCSFPLTNGQLSLSITGWSIGRHVITASYPGNASYAASTSNVVTFYQSPRPR